MKTNRILLGASILIASLLVVPAVNAKSGHKKGHKAGLSQKVMYKAHFILKNATELGLSDQQVKTVKQIKISAKKTKIQKQAQIDLLKVDLHVELHNDTVNLDKVNSLIDSKYEVKKGLAKDMAASIAQLKGTLTAEQLGKMKDLWKSKCKWAKCQYKKSRR